MFKKIQAMVLVTGLLAVGSTTAAFAQSDHGKMGKMSGTKMSHEEMMAKLDKMSVEEKTTLIDKMPVKEKTAAMKAAGQDPGKMSSQDKAAMFDKMPAEQKMKMMMAKGSMMHKGGKMGKMEKP
jgi:hypothetical protein